ncbi:helix-turn-helix domain-containing protein [Micromonospora citrea]|nr:helix-turn-helix domain-containing protein [Micromonospora citrea]
MTDPSTTGPPTAQPAGGYRGPLPELYERALSLRRDGCTVPEIARRVGVARSTAYQWVCHLPIDSDSDEARARRRAHSKVMTDA